MKRFGILIALAVALFATSAIVPSAGMAVRTPPLSSGAIARAHPYIGTRPASRPVGVGVESLPAASTSTNWSGYAVQTAFPTGALNSVTDVKATWIVPAVVAGATDAYSANWIGIDGYSSPTVEQIGTEQDWSFGAPDYYAWWEVYPAAQSFIPTLAVNPGDVMNSEVQWLSGDSFRLTLTDASTAHTFTTVQTVPSNVGGAQRRSAEWVVEAPSSGSGVLPLATIGPSSFTLCNVTVNGVAGSISGAGWQFDLMDLVAGTSAGAPSATPSALSAGGTAFVVTEPGSGDVTPPTTTSDAAASYDNVATVHLSATDNLGGSGVAATHYKVDGGATQTGNLVTVSTYGSHSLSFWSVDVAGNVEAPQPVSFFVSDTIPPSTTSNAVATYASAASIRLTATDNAGGSGVAATYYIVDGVVKLTYAGTPVAVATLGAHTMTFWSVDGAGNTEATHSVGFTVLAKTALSLTASKSSTTRGHSVTLRSTLSGGVPAGTTVRYEVRRPGKSTFVLAATRSVNGSGAATYTSTLHTRGYYYFRVRFLGNSAFNASTSPTRRVHVR